MDAVPLFESTALVADDAILAARVSSLFTRPGRYLPVIDGPRMDRPDSSNEVARRLDAVQRLGAKRLFLVGLDPRGVAAMKRRLAAAVDVAGYDLVRSQLRGYVKLPHEQFQWGTDNLGVGVYQARLERKELVIDPSSVSTNALVVAGKVR